MHIRIMPSDRFTTVCPCGKIDALSCPQLEAAVNDLIDGGEMRIILDLEETIYISSAGLRVILNAAKRLFGSGQLAISSIASDVYNILKVAGIPDAIDVYPDLKIAQAAFSRQ